MGFLKRMLGGAAAPDAAKLASSTVLAEYAQIHLLICFGALQPPHAPGEQQRWSRALGQPYADVIQRFVKQGWLLAQDGRYQAAPSVQPALDTYAARLAADKAAVMPAVRKALEARDTGEALDLRRNYEARFPLGKAEWTGPEPQLSHSALTRRILFMNHWLLDGLSPATVDWLKLYAAEQHLWGTHWRLSAAAIPADVQAELATPAMDGVEAAYWKAFQMGLYVDNHETWQRCKGGDHVRRIRIDGPDDAQTCAVCRPMLGKEYLVARTPDLPPRDCTSPRGCLCRYEPVLETIAE